MRLVTFWTRTGHAIGAVKDDGVVDLTRRTGMTSIRAMLAENRLAEAEEAARNGDPDMALGEVTLDQPLPDAPRIFCVGVNYQNRNEEYKDGSEAPKYPSLFMRTPASFVAHDENLVIPKESEQLDYEGEIVVVVGKAGRRIAEADTRDHIGGLTIMNEGSIRDWIRHGKFNVTQGKNFDKTGGIGPWVETDISGIDLTNLSLETRVNGEVRQKDTTASMAFPIARIMSYISSFTALQPGDLIATGTPTGAGARFDPPIWLKPGDEIEVQVDRIGTLRNGVVAEA
ncbi:fumarylacetoacetate hydrolase family protein [Cucumibacter marinus]|uniref:fumarylacetoacetate hydrolase family protein n=1 Tax=Cucumibacter marinus TaxID=1121252 RepID=UPI0003F4CD40|nr:fumarylacetoacetate hydrolase family protein [Cucumibacter marinus]